MQFFFEPKKKDAEKEEAVEEVLLDGYDRYYRLAYSYVGNPDDAGDIVQEGAYKAIKNSQNETKKINAEIEEIKSALLKLTSNLRYFASENDMKNMEQCILNDFEEYKQAANKKFADKLEMQKAFKYLEIQIKSMTESFSNKEQGDNWLLAKKPIGMFHCASCDSFIGELNTKNEYLPWNKMQPREDNKYRKSR